MKRTFLLLILFLPLNWSPPVHAVTQISPAERAWQHLQINHDAVAAEASEAILKTDPDDARAAHCWAFALSGLDREDEARAYFEQREVSDPQSGIGPLGLGVLRRMDRKHADAESLLSRAIILFVACGDEAGEMVGREQLGWSLIRLGRWQESAASFGLALDLAEAADLPVATAYLHGTLGRALKDASRLKDVDRVDEAIYHLELAIEQAGALDLPWVEAAAHSTFAIVCRWRGEGDAALAHLEAAVSGFEIADHKAALADCHQRIAGTYLYRGELSRATRHLKPAWALAESTGNRIALAMVLNNLGHVRYLTGDFENATEVFGEGVRVARETGNPETMGLSLVNMGASLQEATRNEEALGYFEEARTVFRESGDRRGEYHTVEQMGWCLHRMGRVEDGIRTMKEALELAREIGDVGPTQSFVHLHLAYAHISRGDWDAAERALAAAESIGESILRVREEALRYRAHMIREQGRPNEALAVLEEVIGLREQQRGRLAGAPRLQAGAFGGRIGVYEETIDLLYELHISDPGAGFDRRAFAFAQRAKARSFLDILTEAEIDLRFRADPEFQRREQDILARLGALDEEGDGALPEVSTGNRDEITRLEEELKLLEIEIREADPRYGEIRYPRPVTAGDMQRGVLEDGELLLEYCLGKDASYVWAVTPASFRFLRLPEREAVERDARALLPLLTDYNVVGADPTYFVAAAGPLSEALLEPVADELNAVERVVIAPHGILHYVPFELLLTEETVGRPMDVGFGELPFLVSRVDVAYVPSSSALTRLALARATDANPRARNLLIVGDPTMPHTWDDMSVYAWALRGETPTPLPYAAEEMRAIQSLFPSGESGRLDGRGATLAALKEAGSRGDYRLVHFATHGIFNERRPQFSGLILSSDDTTGDDGFLTIGEVFGLELSCDQIVLSACASALGEEVTGEGLIGLTRAFTYAGARSVVATLWEVSGKATSTFMQHFYEGVARGSGGVSENRGHALAETKRRFIRGDIDLGLGPGVISSHPFFWAAFVMTGDSR